MKYGIFQIDSLLPHERTADYDVQQLSEKIASSGRFTKPIAVGRAYRHAKRLDVILDGHHRAKAMKSLECEWVPAYILLYYSQEVSVEFWAGSEIGGIRDLKSEVVKRAYSRNPFPPKTTKHTFHVKMPDIEVSLSVLQIPKGLE